MFDTTFDIILAAILAVCAVLLLSGKGGFILTSFRSKSEKGQPLPYEEKKLSIAMGLCCVVMFLSELVFIFLGDTNTVVVIISIVAVILSFAIAIWYLRKYAKVEPQKKDSISKKVKDLQKKK